MGWVANEPPPLRIMTASPILRQRMLRRRAGVSKRASQAKEGYVVRAIDLDPPDGAGWISDER